MEAKKTTYAVQGKNILRIVLATLLILLVPLIAMQFTDDVNWSATDFVVAGALLLGTGLVFELGVRRIQNTRQRFIFGLLLLAVLVLVWIELAVGVFGTPFGGR